MKNDVNTYIYNNIYIMSPQKGFNLDPPYFIYSQNSYDFLIDENYISYDYPNDNCPSYTFLGIYLLDPDYEGTIKSKIKNNLIKQLPHHCYLQLTGVEIASSAPINKTKYIDIHDNTFQILYYDLFIGANCDLIA